MAWVDVEPCSTSSATNFASPLAATPLEQTPKNEDPTSNEPFMQVQASRQTREPTRPPTRQPTRRPRGKDTKEPTEVYVYSFGAAQDQDDKPYCREKYAPDKKYETDDVVSSKGDNYKCRLGPWCGEMAMFEPGRGSMAMLVWEDRGPCRRAKKGEIASGSSVGSESGSGSGGTTIDLGTKIEDSITSSNTSPTDRPATNPRPKPGTPSYSVDTVASDEGVGVPPSDSPCPYPWEEGRTYSAGDSVGYQGRAYACLPYPYTGWCGMNVAYNPGVGSQWKSAWEVVGDCEGGGTRQPTGRPTNRPTRQPVEPRPVKEGSTAGDAGASVSAYVNDKNTIKRVYSILDSKAGQIDGKLFLYQGSEPSTVYRYEGFIAGLKVMVEHQMAGLSYYLGDGSENGHLYGLVNIAAFIGQSMKETIQYGEFRSFPCSRLSLSCQF